MKDFLLNKKYLIENIMIVEYYPNKNKEDNGKENKKNYLF